MRPALLAAVFALAAGCSEPTPAALLGPVEGYVTVDGRPLRFGTVVFENDAGDVMAALLEGDGSYTVQSANGLGLPPGSYRVAILPGRMLVPGDESGLADVNLAPPTPAVKVPKVPKKYHAVGTSGLRIEVKAGDNPAFDFSLKGDPVAPRDKAAAGPAD